MEFLSIFSSETDQILPFPATTSSHMRFGIARVRLKTPKKRREILIKTTKFEERNRDSGSVWGHHARPPSLSHLIKSFLAFLVGVILMTKPGKTSSGSWICGFRSTMNGSPHLSLMVWRVSPSPTTYISSHGRSKNWLPLRLYDWPSPRSPVPIPLASLLSLFEATRIRAMRKRAHKDEAASAIAMVALRVLLFDEEGEEGEGEKAIAV